MPIHTTKEPRMLHKNPNLSLFSTILPWAVLVLSAAFFGWCARSYLGTGEDGKELVIFFLLAPSLPTLIALRIKNPIVRIFFSTIMAACLSTILFLWYQYSLQGSEEYGAYSLAAQAVSFSLVTLALILTGLLMQGTATSDRHPNLSYSITRIRGPLVSGMREYAFSTVTFFLGVFICVIYILAFALALHDRNLRDSESIGLYAQRFLAYNGLKEPQDKPRNSETSSIYKILFSQGSADIESFDATGHDAEISKMDDPTVCETFDTSKSASAYRLIHNKNALESISRHIDKLGKDRRLQIMLVGHANEDPLGPANSRYSSNYQLSDARVSAARLFLATKLTVERTELIESWVLSALGAENRYWETPEINEECDVDERRSVELLIRPQSRDTGLDLSLLDYIYFTIYTLTTTGYGDIIPVSSTAKFITGLGNLYEVVFLVIFFNVLLAVSLRKKDEATEPLEPALGKGIDSLKTDFRTAIEAISGRTKESADRVDQSMEELSEELATAITKFNAALGRTRQILKKEIRSVGTAAKEDDSSRQNLLILIKRIEGILTSDEQKNSDSKPPQ